MSSFDAVYDSDLVVIGGGIAGLSVALRSPGRRVTLLSKTPISRTSAGGSSGWAQGGVAAAVGTDDSPGLHAEDTLAAGAGLSVPQVVAVLTEEGPDRVRELIALGARFDLGEDGGLALAREAAHRTRRVLHAKGDATGAEIIRALLAAVHESPWVSIRGEVEAVDLALSEGRVAGVVALNERGERILFRAPAVVLACGGLGHLYAHTTNPRENTGDGLAMAARAGARLADLEFVQFHPTALASGTDPMPLLTEALRGEGAILVDGTGTRFMVEEHELAELAPRDVVARAIWRRLQAGGEVFLDAREAVGESFPQRFPSAFASCQAQGIDPRYELIPVSPAAHFHMGGVATDSSGRTSLAGLWACGEVACTGAHGANRLASNSLLEGLVYGARVAEEVESERVEGAAPSPGSVSWAGEGEELAHRMSPEEEAEKIQELRRLMWREVGLERSAESLERAIRGLRRFHWWLPAASQRLRNLHTVARLVTYAATSRHESRGGHYRSDFPQRDPAWRRRLFAVAEGGELRQAEAWPESAPMAVPVTGEGSR